MAKLPLSVVAGLNEESTAAGYIPAINEINKTKPATIEIFVKDKEDAV